MSTKTEQAAPPTDGRVDLAAIGAPALAQVNLLPPEIRSRRALGRIKVRLGVALLFVVLLAALGFVYALFTEAETAADLAEKQDVIQRLLSEQAQYAEVPQVKGDIAATEEARDAAMSTEVLWADYVSAIQAVTPAGVRLTDLSTAMPGPVTAETPSSSPLDGLSVGSISFTGHASTLPDLASWMDSLNSVPGLQDATFGTADLEDEDGVVRYAIGVTVQVTATAYAGRFVEGEDG